MNTIFVGQANKIHLFNRFANEKYPDLNSLTDLYFDKANKKMLSLKDLKRILVFQVDARKPSINTKVLLLLFDKDYLKNTKEHPAFQHEKPCSSL